MLKGPGEKETCREIVESETMPGNLFEPRSNIVRYSKQGQRRQNLTCFIVVFIMCMLGLVKADGTATLGVYVVVAL